MTNLTNLCTLINDQYPQLLKRNTKDDNAEYILRVVQAAPAWLRIKGLPNERWGLLSKSGGENGYTWGNGVRTSHDAIALPSGERVDIVGGSDSPEMLSMEEDIKRTAALANSPHRNKARVSFKAQGEKFLVSPLAAAHITWNVLPPNYWRPSNVWVDISTWPVLAGGGIDPNNPPIVRPPVPPVPAPIRLPDRGEAMAFGAWLDDFYRRPEGLQRPQGASKDGAPDWEAVGAWMFDVWLRARIAGKSEAEARAAVTRDIQQTGEWKSKHPA